MNFTHSLKILHMFGDVCICVILVLILAHSVAVISALSIC